MDEERHRVEVSFDTKAGSALEQLVETIQLILEVEQNRLKVEQQILAALQEMANPTPVAFNVTTNRQGEKSTMATKHAQTSVDMVILPDGSVLFVATPIDAQGNPTVLPAGTLVPSWIGSAPFITLESPNSDPTGLTIKGKGTAAGVGFVATISTTLAGAAAPITGSGAPVDVVPAPNLPTGFTVAEQ